MDKRIDQVVRKFVSTVAEKNPRFVKAYLFGSYARNQARPDSDIDLALFIDNLEDDEKFDLQVQLILLASEFDSRIEPHPLSNADFNFGNPFVSEIRKTGIEIKI